MDPSALRAALGSLLASRELIKPAQRRKRKPPCGLCSRHTSSHFSLPGRIPTLNPPHTAILWDTARDLQVSPPVRGFLPPALPLLSLGVGGVLLGPMATIWSPTRPLHAWRWDSGHANKV